MKRQSCREINLDGANHRQFLDSPRLEQVTFRLNYECFPEVFWFEFKFILFIQMQMMN
jgi:hypothetical protein